MSRFVVVPASYVYLLRDGDESPAGVARTEVLLQLRSGVDYMDGHWAAAAAGHVERGETSFAAAAREAAEELGVTDVDLRFVSTMHRTQGADPIDERVDFFFTSRTWTGEPTIMEPTKCGALGWFPLDALPSPMVPHEAQLLSLLAAGDVPGYTTFGF